MDASTLIESFADFAKQKNIDRPTMIRILEDVFRNMIRKKYVQDDNFDIIVNADKIVVTANKAAQSFAYRHSGYPGGLTSTSWQTLLDNDPAKLVFDAIKGMVPKNRLGRAQMAKLFVYAGPEHPHMAQQPVAFDTTAIRRG